MSELTHDQVKSLRRQLHNWAPFLDGFDPTALYALMDSHETLRQRLAEVEEARDAVLNMRYDLPVGDVAKTFLDYGRLYYRTTYDEGIQARLEELLQRARLDGANAMRQQLTNPDAPTS